VQIKAAREGAHVRQLARRDGRDGAGVHAPAQIGPYLHIADKLPVDGLLEQAGELINVFFFSQGSFGLLEFEVPVAMHL
jgi:hypothetical protein